MSLETRIEMFGNPSSEFFIAKNELHKLLNPGANRNSDYWDLQGPGLEVFAKKLFRLFTVSNGGFTFQATWSGEQPSRVESMSFEEFIQVVKSNRIGKRTKYIVVGSV